MIYAHLIIRDTYDCNYDSKIVAENEAAYNAYKATIKEYGCTIIDEFVDNNIGTIVQLPEDFKC